MIRECPILLLGALLAFGCAPPQSTSGAAPERIVLVVADTLRADHVGVYGGEFPTPNLDALAARGQALPALASYHQTSMSMAALFTGQTPSVELGRGRALAWAQTTFCGMARLRERGDPCLPPAPGTLAQDLAAAGYETIAVTANPLLFRPYGYDLGFDVWREVGEVPPDRHRRKSRRAHAESRTGAHVHEAVLDVLAARRGDRFFLYVHYLDVHDWILRGHVYHEGVGVFDGWLGELLAALESEGLLEDSLVVVTADHGELLAGEPHPLPSRTHQGNPSYESVLRVPLIVAPAAFDEGQTLRGQDLRARLAALARGELPPAAEASDPELFVSELRYRTYRQGSFKSVWPREGGGPLLFDLARDPGETRDVAARYGDLLARHRSRIDALSEELATGRRDTGRLDPEAAERLRALGYLD